jgi:hypothetical protein
MRFDQKRATCPLSSSPHSKSNIQNPAGGSSYGQILRSSSIIGGGAIGIDHLIATAHPKLDISCKFATLPS